MFKDRKAETLIALISAARAEVLGKIKESSSVGPKDWHLIDEIMGATFDEIIKTYMQQLVMLMERIVEADITISNEMNMELLRLNVHGVMLTSVLSAHFDVIKETGRNANDAHLHLDRVRRCADTEQTVAVAAIYYNVGDRPS